MKKLLCILLVLCVCFSLAACSGGGDKGGTTNPTKAPSGGNQPSGGNEPAEDPMAYTLVMGAKDDVTSEGKNLILDTLTWRLNHYEATDYLVSCEPNADYTEYTLHVTPGITFSDGTPLTAEVIKYSIEALAPSTNLGFKDVLSEVEVVDDSTCKLRFGGKSFLTLEFELSYIFCIKPGAATEEGNITEWIGTGPYILVDRQPDTSATLERREDYLYPAGIPLFELMLFDEPTSSLDILNEKGLLMTIDQNFADKTVVMISHRNSTLGACSRVCKVRDGKVAGEES